MENLTRKLECPCGASVVLASGYNAEAMKPDQIERAAAKVKWQADPPRCPVCVNKKELLPPDRSIESSAGQRNETI